MKPKPRVLAVDDEPGVVASLEAALDGHCTVIGAGSGAEAVEIFARRSVDLVLLDLLMPEMDGMQTLERLRRISTQVPVIMLSAADRASAAVEALQKGAYSYLTKPFDLEELRSIIRRALDGEKRQDSGTGGDDEIVGISPVMQSLLSLIAKVAASDVTVLLTGESGTGKELVARTIHRQSRRNGYPLVTVNCAGIPETLMESELFGHEKGAFTDAFQQKQGQVEAAQGGTLFLDEIGELRPSMQAKLLRMLEAREIRRVGGVQAIPVDVRIISATNVDLQRAVADGRFRSDLYYRLNVVPVHLPPLRDRPQDIPLLLERFLDMSTGMLGRSIEGFEPEVISCLQEYAWPGNVRELRNLVERMVALAEGETITLTDLPLEICMDAHSSVSPAAGSLRDAVNDFQRRYIAAVLQRTRGNRTSAARLLGIHRNALLNKIKSLDLT